MTPLPLRIDPLPPIPAGLPGDPITGNTGGSSGGGQAGSSLQLSYYLYDHLGNTRMVFHTVLKVDEEDPTYVPEYLADYYPYGKILREWLNCTGERYLTTQHERDIETGYDYRGARFYDADLGRFLSVDPLAAEYAGWSGYHYAADNPVLVTDPTGMDWYVNNKTGDYQWFDGNERVDGYTGVGYYKVEYDRGNNILNVYKGKDAELIRTIDMNLDENGRYKTEEAAVFALISAETGGSNVHDADPTIQPLIIGAIIDNRLKLDALGVAHYSSDGTAQGMSSGQFHALRDRAYSDFKYGNERRFGTGTSTYQRRLMNIGLSTTFTGTLDAVLILKKYYSVTGREQFQQMLFYAHGKGNPVSGDFDVAIPVGTSAFQYVRGSSMYSKYLGE